MNNIESLLITILILCVLWGLIGISSSTTNQPTVDELKFDIERLQAEDRILHERITRLYDHLASKQRWLND